MKTLMQHHSAFREARTAAERSAAHLALRADIDRLNTDDLWAVVRSTSVGTEVGAIAVTQAKLRLGVRA